MVLIREHVPPKKYIATVLLKRAEHFKYLGAIISEDDELDQDLNGRRIS